MTTTVNAYRASEPGGRLEPYQFELGELGHGQVDIDVDSCGICYRDVSMIDNDWGFTPYPITPGHEIVGRIRAVGPAANRTSAPTPRAPSSADPADTPTSSAPTQPPCSPSPTASIPAPPVP